MSKRQSRNGHIAGHCPKSLRGFREIEKVPVSFEIPSGRVRMTRPAMRFAVLACVLACGAAAMAAEPAEPRIDSYMTTDGTRYFAVSLTPNVTVPQSNTHDVVILFDTSASQSSVFRDKALETLAALLAGLNRGDRAHLMAVDLEAVPLTTGFVAPDSSEMTQAIAALKARAPLGATDIPDVLRAAAASFGEKATAKAVIYIGDGMSSANFMSLEDYRKLIDTLVEARVPVSSYAVGPRVDAPLLASLANQTGGMLAVDDESMDSKHAGAYLASAAHGAVLWPQTATWPKTFVEVLPSRMPPLRTDRDTIVVGKSAGAIPAEVKIKATVQAAGESRPMTWTLAARESNPDFAFLPALVEGAHGDQGLRLITVGTPGLRETRRLLGDSAEVLAKLSGQAIATGNLETAERLADEEAQGSRRSGRAGREKPTGKTPHPRIVRRGDRSGER